MLLAVVMASALERMRLYVAEFGLSEIRLYGAAFMGYLFVLFAWFAATVLRSRRGRFALGGVVQGLAVLGMLHLVNPDALIARVNLDRAGRDERVDDAYLVHNLSADAVPLLLDRLPHLDVASRCRVAEGCSPVGPVARRTTGARGTGPARGLAHSCGRGPATSALRAAPDHWSLMPLRRGAYY
jgi:hypothetical protein